MPTSAPQPPAAPQPDELAGVNPTAFAILRDSAVRTQEYVFATRAAATTQRARLYKARQRLLRAHHPLAPLLVALRITVPKERAALAPHRGITTEWYWTIGQDDPLAPQYEAQMRAAGREPYAGAPAAEPPSPPVREATQPPGAAAAIAEFLNKR